LRFLCTLVQPASSVLEQQPVNEASFNEGTAYATFLYHCQQLCLLLLSSTSCSNRRSNFLDCLPPFLPSLRSKSPRPALQPQSTSLRLSPFSTPTFIRPSPSIVPLTPSPTPVPLPKSSKARLSSRSETRSLGSLSTNTSLLREERTVMARS
jgi:hypothetical protein